VREAKSKIKKTVRNFFIDRSKSLRLLLISLKKQLAAAASSLNP